MKWWDRRASERRRNMDVSINDSVPDPNLLRERFDWRVEHPPVWCKILARPSQYPLRCKILLDVIIALC